MNLTMRNLKTSRDDLAALNARNAVLDVSLLWLVRTLIADVARYIDRRFAR